MKENPYNGSEDTRFMEKDQLVDFQHWLVNTLLEEKGSTITVSKEEVELSIDIKNDTTTR